MTNATLLAERVDAVAPPHHGHALAAEALPQGRAVVLVAGGSGPELLRATLARLGLPPSGVWCAVPDTEECVAAAGLARVVVMEPWPGRSQALHRLARASAAQRGDAPVVLICAGTRLRSGFLDRAVRRLNGGDGAVIGTRTRAQGIRLRLRLRWLGNAGMLPGSGVAVRSGTLLLLQGMGWLEGVPLTVKDVASLSGGVSVIGGSLGRLDAPRRRTRLSVTVMIPAHNERAWVGLAIRSVQSQTTPPDEIIVIDDESSDGTGDIARALGVRVVRPPLRQGRKGAALNAGLPYVRTDMVVILDADTTLHPQALELLEQEIGSGKDAATGSVLPSNEEGIWPRGRLIEYCVAMAVHKRVQQSFNALMVLSGCIAAYRTDALRSIGGFQDRTVGEDMDVTWTLHLDGFHLGYVGNAVAYTVEPATWKLYKGQMRRWSAAFFQTISVHRRRLGRRAGLLFLVAAGLWDVVTAPLALVVVPALIATGTVRGHWTMWAFSVGFVAVSSVIAGWYLGVRRTIRSVPAFVVISLTNSYFMAEALVREWGLRRRHAGWIKGH